MIYRGIDFANRDSNLGRCLLQVDNANKLLTPAADTEPEEAHPTAVDCAFGTTIGFTSLLAGNIPAACHWDRGFKTRATEHWLRTTLWDYQTNNVWRNLPDTSPQHYVNKTGHVQSSVGLVIVPAFLNWFLTSGEQTLLSLEKARLGNGDIVEAHPRPFLYSAIERIYCHSGRPDVNWREVLRDVVTYKDRGRTSHVQQRKNTYAFLREYSRLWLWDDYTLSDANDSLFETDHRFDAFLAALTAFAHASKQTIDWQAAATSEPALTKEVVATEGHILILSQRAPNTAVNPEIVSPTTT